MRKNNVRKTKTYKVDTYIICKTLMMQDSLRFVTFYDLNLMNLKTLGRFRQKAIKQRTRLKLQLTSYVDEVFPELQYFFKSSLHQKSVGANNSALSIQITHTIQQIELLDSQLERVDAEMTDIMKFNDSVINTIPGIGYINSGMILGEIGDIHRFSCPNKLHAYAGLNPSVYQSGNFQAKKTRMSKRGSKVLKYALIKAAHNAVKNNATSKAYSYYDAKMAEGRTHYNILGHCAGKLVRIIWKMMTDNVEFNREYETFSVNKGLP